MHSGCSDVCEMVELYRNDPNGLATSCAGQFRDKSTAQLRNPSAAYNVIFPPCEAQRNRQIPGGEPLSSSLGWNEFFVQTVQQSIVSQSLSKALNA